MILIAVQLLIAIACLLFIVKSIRGAELVQISGIGLPESIVLLVLILMMVNWALEGWRWQISIPHERLSFHQSFIAVLRGQALNWIMPFTTGDIGARLIGVEHKAETAIAITLNRVVILLITLVYGMVGILAYLGMNQMFWMITPIVLLLLGVLFILNSKEGILGFPFKTITGELTLKVIVITLLRYAVFTLQFYILIAWFNPALNPFIILAGIGWIFLFKSFVPSILGNIGVREASALVFFEGYVQNLELVVWPCTLIWLINSVLPSIIGCLTFIPFKTKLAA